MEPLELSSNTSTHTVLAENERRKRRTRHENSGVRWAAGSGTVGVAWVSIRGRRVAIRSDRGNHKVGGGEDPSTPIPSNDIQRLPSPHQQRQRVGTTVHRPPPPSGPYVRIGGWVGAIYNISRGSSGICLSLLPDQSEIGDDRFVDSDFSFGRPTVILHPHKHTQKSYTYYNIYCV